MRRSHNRLPAFSMIEMLVVMTISGLVMGAVYVAYVTVNGYQVRLAKRLEQVQEVGSLYDNLTLDFERASRVTYENQSIRCRTATGEVLYRIISSCVVRVQANRIDTISCKVVGHTAFHLGKLALDGQLIDGLEIVLDQDDQLWPLHLRKHYDAAAWVHHEEDSIRQTL